MSVSPWVGKQRWYIHAVEYHAAVKRNRVLTPSAMSAYLKNIMLWERGQTQKVWLRVHSDVQNPENYKGRRQASGCLGLGVVLVGVGSDRKWV